jgi:hypothetical protein
LKKTLLPLLIVNSMILLIKLITRTRYLAVTKTVTVTELGTANNGMAFPVITVISKPYLLVTEVTPNLGYVHSIL